MKMNMIRSIKHYPDRLRGHCISLSQGINHRTARKKLTCSLVISSLPNWDAHGIINNSICGSIRTMILSQSRFYSNSGLIAAKSKKTSVKVDVSTSKSRKTKYQSKTSNGTTSKEVVPTKRAGFIAPAKLTIYTPFFKHLSKVFTKEDIRDMIVKTVEFHDNLIKSHGIKDGTARFKQIFLYCTGLLEGRNPANPGWVATSKLNKFPSKLAHLRPLYVYIKDNTHITTSSDTVAEGRRLFLCLSKINRVCKDFSELEVTNIKSTFKIPTEEYNGFEAYAKARLGKAVKRRKFDECPPDLTAIPFFGSSNGPNGIPKLESADAEAYEIVYRRPEFKEQFYEFLHKTENFALKNYMESRAEVFRDLITSDRKERRKWSRILIRKLTQFPDKANKGRVIAICEYWTQSLLVPIERLVLSFTKELYSKNIAYFGHSAGWNKVLSFPDKKQLVSLDATEWTDNLPSSLQHIVLKIILGQAIADCWLAVAVKCPWNLENSDRTIKYGKGQGMGTKGSFVIAQLTNLLFLEWKLKEAYPHTNSFFIEVGDDMVIQDPNFLIKSKFEIIGVPINVTKSKVATIMGNFTEFVSRNSWNEYDISLISPSLLLKFRQDDYYIITLLNHCRERNVNTNLNSLLDIKTNTLYNEGLTKRAERCAKSKDNLFLLASLIDYGHGHRLKLVDNPFHYLSKLSLQKTKTILSNLVLIPVIKYYNHIKELSKLSRDQRIANERLLVLHHNYRESNLSIWAFAHKEGLDLVAIKALITSSQIFTRQSVRAERGQQVYESGTRVFPKVIVPWVHNPALREVNAISYQYINECLALINKVNNIVLDTKLVSRLSIDDKANTKALRELMADLNRCVHSSIEFNSTGMDATITYRMGKETVTCSLSDIRQILGTQGLTDQMDVIRNLSDISPAPWADLYNMDSNLCKLNSKTYKTLSYYKDLP